MIPITHKVNARWLILAALICIGSPAVELRLDNWTSLESEMKAHLDGTFSQQALMKGPLFSGVLASKNSGLFLEMMAFRDHPLRSYGGFLCLKESNPELLFVPAMDLVLHSESPGIEFFDPIYEYLRSQKKGGKFRACFSHVASESLGNYHRFVFLLTYLSTEALLDWFDDPNRAHVSTTAEAAVLDRLFTNKDGLIPSENMIVALGRLRETPGFPRAIFAIHAKESVQNLHADLESVLTDESIDDNLIRIVMVNKIKVVNQLAKKIKLPASRKALLAKLQRIKSQ